MTALYEIVPVGAKMSGGISRIEGIGPVDPLIYQQPSRASGNSPDLFTVKVRYKLPDADTSTLMTKAVREGGATRNVPFAAAVAEFAQLLRDGERSSSRWTSFARRVNTLDVVVNPVDQNEFAALVALAGEVDRPRGR